MTALIALSFFIITGAAIAAATEVALFSTPLIKVREVAQTGSRTARVLLGIRESMSRPISAIVIVNNTFNIIGSLAVGAMAAETLSDFSLGVFSAVFTFVIIILSEIIPKTLGERYSLPIALVTARPVAFITKLLTPLIWTIEKIASPMTPRPRTSSTTEREIMLLVRIAEQEGIVQPDEAEMIHRTFRLKRLTAQDLMTPRVSMTSLPGDLTLEEAHERIIASEHSRIVVTAESSDDVQGILLKPQALAALISGRGDERLSAFLRPARFVPTMAHSDKLLRLFQQHHEHIAIVVDEFGGVAGVVSLEDVLEVLTGEIVDETDRVMDLQEAARQKHWRLRLISELKKEH